MNELAVCSGVAMLSEGVRAAFEHLGLGHRTVCHIEREAPAAAQLVALMEAGIINTAPVWSDLRTFDGAAWRGCVDIVTAGFPCQDISIAGKRAGLDGRRSGLFFDILDIADACCAWLLALENVSAIATATASVVDEEEGALEERAAARVVGELADRGWDSEWITLSAAEVGASHGRARWFCLAWRVAHAERAERRPVSACGTGCIQGDDRGRREADGWTGVADAALGHAECARRAQAGCGPDLDAGRQSEPRCGAMDITTCDGWNEGRAESIREQGRPDAAECGSALADAACIHGGQRDGQRKRATAVAGRESRPEGCCCAVADASGTGLPQRVWGGGDDGSLQQAERPEPSGLRSALPIFAPGPTDPRWGAILAEHPHLAPALEPGFRVLAHELAVVVDQSRNHQLRQIGNGVVPLQAALSFVLLARRAGIFERSCLMFSEPTTGGIRV